MSPSTFIYFGSLSGVSHKPPCHRTTNSRLAISEKGVQPQRISFSHLTHLYSPLHSLTQLPAYHYLVSVSISQLPKHSYPRRLSMPDASAWKQRAIYQIVTDRFAVTDHGGGFPDLDYTKRQYCGGTWQGIISKLDYIQGMGFDAIWISPVR
jgi:hypothetical protein